MVVHSTTLAGTDTILLLTFMNARPNMRAALPMFRSSAIMPVGGGITSKTRESFCPAVS